MESCVEGKIKKLGYRVNTKPYGYIDTANMWYRNEIIDEFSRNALETLKFLQDSQEQMPASKDWIDKYELLIEFLLDAGHL